MLWLEDAGAGGNVDFDIGKYTQLCENIQYNHNIKLHDVVCIVATFCNTRTVHT